MRPDDVKAKKQLGQHFLKDEQIAADIVASLSQLDKYKKVLEVGPGMGVLTQFLLQNSAYETSIIDIDRESIAYLKKRFPELQNRIIEGDFLHLRFEDYFTESFAVIGNFPYNISTQILFKVLDYRNQIPEVVGMFQKEVALRIASKPGKKVYGILSVFMQAYYDIEYLFTVEEHVFQPPPKVKSGVIRCVRNTRQHLDCNETLFFQVVKAGFNQRRKTLRNALKQMLNGVILEHDFLAKRAEELSVENFVELTNLIDKSMEIK
ncbi:MAG: 16S rRNA (adenine(1518)-N(6)/adenine(1519)-N(6))-dimethyltransferase RsmA [Bacteroidetes bacterium]|nr:16S rRNA (adenine(1518)-N(6)/adenine(1519)-N(6))-dimethyltransferase RsmA [Bacteroidota bacterium]